MAAMSPPGRQAQERAPLREVGVFVALAFAGAWIVGGLAFVLLGFGQLGLGVGEALALSAPGFAASTVGWIILALALATWDDRCRAPTPGAAPRPTGSLGGA